jgi:DNA polymerase
VGRLDGETPLTMATRDAILSELGLAPTWQLRARRGLAVEPLAREPATSAVTGALPANAAARAAVLNPAPAGSGDAADPRIIRIANLDWGRFAQDVDGCVACGLAHTRKRSVPGVGDIEAEWLFVGEAPGAEEDARGEPFVGQAGKLLDNMLAALGLRRGANVYIANVLKCRPPNNRAPEPREVEACRPYLDRQIELIRPKVIVALGKSAATTLLDMEATIASLRGRVHRYAGVPLVVTYHPAYLLRNLPDKQKAWEDLLFARRTLRSGASPGAGPAAFAEVV